MKYFLRTLFTILSIFLFSFDSLLAVLPPIKDGNNTVINISYADIGKSKRLNVGLNKVVILRVPSVVQDVLVSDPSKADVVMHSSNTMYLFGKDIGQANVILLGHDGKQILNLDITVEHDVVYLEATLRRFIPDSKINVEMVSGSVVLHGVVRNIQDSQRAVELAETYFAKNHRSSVNNIGGNHNRSQVINLLNISGEDQVTLKVTIAEVRREILKQIGFQYNIMRSATPGSGKGGAFFDQAGFSNFSVAGFLDKFAFEGVLRSLERANAIRTLAEPTLTAISGQSASFRSGGERLYQSQDRNGVANLSSHKYGVSLTFTPTVLSPGRIGLRIQTEVSEPSMSIGAGKVPEFRLRKAETTVELPSGGTIVLAGLLKDDIQQTRQGVPLLSKIPILGALFRQSDFVREEAEIFISATPFLVRPVAMNSLDRPDDHYAVENDSKSFFLNRVNKIYGTREEIESNNYKGAIGFIYK
ncbi:type II and III secretion system protein family protein [Candidatus Liberibacter africanus]|uniref:Putative pilus assembly protein n=1 Tax=Candidatus Liberibacter africanus PTSAPSY TaxID=1277257 RepID=A0A0G3I2D3_LIBAF|nr:type II and III secretion system protein family protein [Candidatus Liberibacter africanus]AKK20024.1 putative pilus assembly protein [Candidatus Liberibacter africanus PTSAPSY]QTP63851.1 type II and III secretion system protein family protein [Candidatus Liberibacter africanus]